MRISWRQCVPSPRSYIEAIWVFFFYLLGCIQGLNTNMLEATDDWEFLWRTPLIPLCSLMPVFALLECSCCSGLKKRSQRENGRKEAPLALSNRISVACRDLCSLKGRALTLRLNTCYILIFCWLTFRIIDQILHSFQKWCCCLHDELEFA